ncbi:DegT/DnrJ/EryC1/StrS family aminotransferase [Blastopirellula marina]|uniref:GDP-perosamine synthase n=1 Tax=Blastopirellula marina DSM 3645 TaxID=314230 RepID=A4A141_9BACT|nr:DegT/DnrJ/EryC1/StrS family aminotransferase [Blastopirellula marina]EAQ77501.1 perosamine synthetase [Blastopirellula marina DSM 3645]
MWKIPVASADVTGKEEEYVVEAIRSSWISSSGAFVDRFEKEFSELCDTKHALSCANGTVALHLAILGLGLRPGDEVIVPSMTYIATANAVRYCGAEPVFIDIDPNTWCMDPTQIEEAITPRTRGIIAVHLLGHPADMDAINEIASIHGLWVVEDAAEAHFALYKGKPVGSLGSAATFSFFGNKLFTCGEGGAVTVNSDQLSLRLKTLRGQGMDPRKRYYFPVIGYNYRLTNVACAMLCAQLERRSEIMSRRIEIFQRYNEGLAQIPGVRLQPIASWATHSPWMHAVLIDSTEYGRTRDEVISGLAAKGIDSRPFFVPIHTLPPYQNSPVVRDLLPHTDFLGSSGLMLPTYNALTNEDIDTVVHIISELSTARLRRAA